MKGTRITTTFSLALACTLAGCASTDEQNGRDDILHQGPRPLLRIPPFGEWTV